MASVSFSVAASVLASVSASVAFSVAASVLASVAFSVAASVLASVLASVAASVFGASVSFWLDPHPVIEIVKAAASTNIVAFFILHFSSH